MIVQLRGAVRGAFRGAAAVLALGLALAGCGNAPGVEGRRAELKAMFVRPAAPAQPVGLTAAAVAASPAPLVELRTATRQTVAIKVAESGGVASFASADGVGLGLRDQMLVSVKGLHSDVMSAEAPSAARIAAASGSHMRSYQILDGLGVLQKPRFSCSLERRGAEAVSVAGRSFATTLVAETCRNETGRFENLYWIDGSGEIRQSDQWIGSGVDFLRLSFG